MAKKREKSIGFLQRSLFRQRTVLSDELPVSEIAEEDVMTVGDQLRAAREERGLTLHMVADSLRLKAPQIQALESGDFDTLPGQTFVTGFLRSYANLLDLDAVAIVDIYKQEHVDGMRTPSLSFPEPNSAGRMPGAGIMIGALVLALIFVAGWLVYQENNSLDFERVAELPDSLTQKVEAALAIEKAEAEAAAKLEAERIVKAAAIVTSEVKSGDEMLLVTNNNENQQVISEQDVLAKQQVSTETKPVDTEVEETSSEPGEIQPNSETLTASKLIVTTTSSESSLPAQEKIEQAPVVVASVPDVTPKKVEPATPLTHYPQAVLGKTAVAPDEDRESPLPRTFGVENTNARVVLRAKAETWVEVRVLDQKPLISRVLRPGDVFMAPDNPQATLTTGNAGGLEISVDGKQIASLGGTGTIVRDLSLVASSLLDGSATLQ